MKKKYKILLCLSIPAVFLIFCGHYVRETRLNSKLKHPHVSETKKNKVPLNLADKDNMVAAILIMPKSYLPALEQFANSAMAKNITILRARLESKDGRMTAVYNKKENRHADKIPPVNSAPSRINDTILKRTPERDKQILTAGFLFILASVRQRAILR
jgi:hypothetical protein